MGKRLKKADWIEGGLEALAADGPGVLAAEPMCRRMGTSKGSFYWHFADVPAFHLALIETWQARALQDLADTVSADTSANQRLRAFGRGVLSDRSESAMRVWGQSDTRVAAALRIVDTERLTYLNLVLRQVGLGNPDFANALLSALIGLPQLKGPDGMAIRTAFDALVDTVLALAD